MDDYINSDFINGVGLQVTADAVIDVNRRDSIDKLPSRAIVWCKTDYIDEFFHAIRDIDNKIILITHSSDHEIDEEVFSRRPACIKRWFAQNVNFVHPQLIPIPIGIENHIGPNKGSSIDIEYIRKSKRNHAVVSKNTGQLYVNFSLQTNKNRANVRNTIANRGIGFVDVKRSFADYCDIMKQFLFVASPRGTGIDCHRTWEALYMGCVPVVEKHAMYNQYRHLPIVQIDDWSTFQMSQLDPYVSSYLAGTCFSNTKELSLTYWASILQQEKLLL